MTFNSTAFLIFLPIVLAIYWLSNRWTSSHFGLRFQNLLLLVASYVFYGWWDWRFLGLIAFSTAVDYAVGLQMGKHRQRSRAWLAVSILTNIGLLACFKYANFFIESWVEAWRVVGFEMNAQTLKFILPVGISFYTFQTLSYSIDVHRGKLKPTRNFVAFAAFVSFFPQLVAGPIERAKHLLPQLQIRRKADAHQITSGVLLMVWGMFKKIVVADTCGFYADAILNDNQIMPAPIMWTGLVLFSFQIYGDFSGYSDMAIGIARLFGIQLSTNFKTPYFSRDIAEFWRRWHISLSTWFRDYVYFPLGGSRTGKWKVVRNTLVIFLISGFWHGANWTFVAWGLLHWLYFLPLLLSHRNRTHVNAPFRFHQLPSILTTFVLVTLAWAFFRADSISHAVYFLKISLDGELRFPSRLGFIWGEVGSGIALMFLIEGLMQLRWIREKYFNSICALIISLHVLTLYTISHITGETPAFIYFQF